MHKIRNFTEVLKENFQSHNDRFVQIKEAGTNFHKPLLRQGTVALISSPSPFYLRSPKRRAAIHLQLIYSYSGPSQHRHCKYGCSRPCPKPPSTTSVACRCPPWLGSNPVVSRERSQRIKPFSQSNTEQLCKGQVFIYQATITA